jgi:hypothetical protein
MASFFGGGSASAPMSAMSSSRDFLATRGLSRFSSSIQCGARDRAVRARVDQRRATRDLIANAVGIRGAFGVDEL